MLLLLRKSRKQTGHPAESTCSRMVTALGTVREWKRRNPLGTNRFAYANAALACANPVRGDVSPFFRRAAPFFLRKRESRARARLTSQDVSRHKYNKISAAASPARRALSRAPAARSGDIPLLAGWPALRDLRPGTFFGYIPENPDEYGARDNPDIQRKFSTMP
jgi:hypothetical protein